MLTSSSLAEEALVRLRTAHHHGLRVPGSFREHVAEAIAAPLEQLDRMATQLDGVAEQRQAARQYRRQLARVDGVADLVGVARMVPVATAVGASKLPAADTRGQGTSPSPRGGDVACRTAP
jgi:hypothetical protein